MKRKPLDVKAVREHLGESQKTFARRFGVNQCTVSRWETEGLPNRGPLKLLEREIRGLRNVPSMSDRPFGAP
jgi:DNA-binding transcriptional regulator YiaG